MNLRQRDVKVGKTYRSKRNPKLTRKVIGFVDREPGYFVEYIGLCW